MSFLRRDVSDTCNDAQSSDRGVQVLYIEKVLKLTFSRTPGATQSVQRASMIVDHHSVVN
jgi:hypothetical protein